MTTWGPADEPIWVSQVMTREPICADRSDTVHDLARLFEEHDISGIPVVDEVERLIGVVSKTDLVRRCVEGPPGAREGTEFWDALREGFGGAEAAEELGTAEDLMSIEPVTARPDESLAAAARRMARNRVHRLVVIDEDRRPLGIVTTLDLLAHFPSHPMKLATGDSEC